MTNRKIAITASALVVLGFATSITAGFLDFGSKKDTAKSQVESSSDSKPVSSEKLRITAHFTNIFAEIEPTPVIRRAVKAGEEFKIVDSSTYYWIIRDGSAAGYVDRNAAAIVGSLGDTVLMPIIDTISTKDIPTSRTSASVPTLDTMVKPAAKAIQAKQDSLDMVERAASKGSATIPVLISLLIISVIAGGSYWTALRRKALRRVKFRSAILVMNSFEGFPIDYGTHSFSLKNFLLRFGIALDQTRSLQKLPGLMAEIEPDFIFVDWRIAPDVVDLFRQLLGQYRLASSITVVFCYVDLSGIAQFKNDFGTTPIHVFSGVPTGQQLTQILSGEGKPYHRGNEIVEGNSHLTGTISETSLEDLLQLIDTSKKSGVLTISDENIFGEIAFHEGGIVHASNRNGTVGTPAIYEILGLTDGTFSLDNHGVPVERTMEESIMAILMGWSAHKDQQEILAE